MLLFRVIIVVLSALRQFLIILLVTSGLLLSALAQPVDIYHFSSEAEGKRFTHLTKELRCLVCQNQSLADSDAVLAKDLRDKIYQLINEKKSDVEIKQFLVSRYGEFILFSPPLKWATLLLWGFPLFLLILVCASLFFWKRRNTESQH